jgi:hypothetical protein
MNQTDGEKEPLTLERRRQNGDNKPIPLIRTCCPHSDMNKTYGQLLNLKAQAAVKGKQHPKINDRKYQALGLPADFRGKNPGEPVLPDDQRRYALEVCETLLNDNMLQDIVNDIIASEGKMRAAGKTPKVLKLILPQSVISGQSRNMLSIAFAISLEKRLEPLLKGRNSQLSVEVDFDSITTLTKADRGKISHNATDEEIKLNDVGRLARQHCFGGTVDPDVLYGIVDDSVFFQSTVRNLHDFITGNRGTVAFISCLTHGYAARDMNVGEASGKLLKKVLDRNVVTMDELNNILNDKEIFGKEGLYFGYAKDTDPPKLETNLTQFEVLLLTAYFGDRQDKDELIKVMEPLCEGEGRVREGEDRWMRILKKAKLWEVLNMPPGNVGELKDIFCEALKKREKWKLEDRVDIRPRWVDFVVGMMRGNHEKEI